MPLYPPTVIAPDAVFANEVMNFPSLEGADDAQPEWWAEADANATLTEVDVAGEAGITESYERAHKVVVATANSYASQRYTYADQPRIKSGVKVSALFAVWSVSGVSARIRLQTSVGSLGVSATTTAAGWTLLRVDGVTLDGTYVEIREEVDIGTAYFVPLGINLGSRALALPPRGLLYRNRDATTVKTLGGLGDENTWTDVDVTSATSNLAVMAQLNGFVFDTVNDFKVYFRRNGSAQAANDISIQAMALGASQGDYGFFHTDVILDQAQIFEYLLDRTAGSTTLVSGLVNLQGWWEWA